MQLFKKKNPILFISFLVSKIHYTFPHIEFTLFDTIANNERFQDYQKDDIHIFAEWKFPLKQRMLEMLEI